MGLYQGSSVTGTGEGPTSDPLTDVCDVCCRFQTMKTHRQLSTGSTELVMLANHIHFLVAADKMKAPEMRKMLHTYLQKKSDGPSDGWPFYTQMELKLGEVCWIRLEG